MKSQRGNDARFIPPSVVFAIALFLSNAYQPPVWAQQPARNAASPDVQSSYRGGLVTPPLMKPTFTLTDTENQPFDFRARTAGFVTLLFFGYTHCPDMCPTEMAMVASAMKQLPTATANKFKVVFVTTDPDRDTPDVLKNWLGYFNKRFIGLTGTPATITQAQIAANIPPAKKSAVHDGGEYEVGHASFVLAYTRDDLAHVIYPVGLRLDDWVHDLPLLAAETWGKLTP